MRSKISAIIVDKDYKYRDYSQIGTNDGSVYSEKSFELKILPSTNNILSEIYEFNGVDAIITIGDRSCWGPLAYMPFSIRKKWTHIDVFDPQAISSNIVSTFLCNLTRTDGPLLFSFFTCTHNTNLDVLGRLYKSMKNQTYPEWNWFIIDDSDNDCVCREVEEYRDPRITVIRTCV